MRKVLGLAFLGIAIGLAANQILLSWRHEVKVEINLSDDLVRNLIELELRVNEVGSAAEAVSLTRLFFDDSHRPASRLNHVLNIKNGHYDLRFIIKKSSAEAPIIETRVLEVIGAMQVGYYLQ